MAGHNDFAGALRALRDGEINFDRFARDYRTRFVVWARRLLVRWPPSHLTEDDLIQEGYVECWRSLDYWDPLRGVALDRYVTWRILQHMGKVLSAVSGRPRRDRPPVLRPVRMTVEFEVYHEQQLSESPIDRVEAQQAINCCSRGIVQEAATGVLLGMDSAAIASYLYEDPDRRLRYRFDSVRNARHKVKRAIDCAARQIDLNLDDGI